MTKIKILTGSTRPGRFNIQPAAWLFDIAKKRAGIEVELVDLEALALPFLDEPITPMNRQYSKEHTFAWSKIVEGTDGFVFVTPEYNHSYAPALKNALDYLFYEWHYKPVSFVSYGSLAGGSRAVEHLRGVAAELKMYDLREQILLPNYWENLNDEGKYSFTEHQVKSAEELIESLAFWAQELKASREKLAVKTT
jgi:NAD(P)H-dependent FMN reductase